MEAWVGCATWIGVHECLVSYRIGSDAVYLSVCLCVCLCYLTYPILSYFILSFPIMIRLE